MTVGLGKRAPGAGSSPLPVQDPISVHTPSGAKVGQRRSYRTVALIIACALFMEHMDATILATALPTMARDFRVPVTNVSTALTAYLLALAIFIPASGRIADRLGSKTVFRAAIVVFLAGSILCGLAPSMSFLVFARFLQGIGGSMMVPIGRLVLLRSVDKADLVQAMTWLVMPGMIGPIVGPPLGGLIVTYSDWRWIFYLNIPIGLLGVVLVTKFIDQVQDEAPAPLDLVGFVLAGVSLGCLLFGFEMTSRPGELGRAASLVLIGLISGLAYVLHARRRLDPILDLGLLAVPTFRLAVIGGSLIRITQGALPLLLPLMLQLNFGMTAAKSGTITIASVVGAFTMRWLAPSLLKRVTFRKVLVVNGLVSSAGYAICGLFRPSWPTPVIFAVLAVNGFLMSFQFTVYNSVAYADIDKPRMSSATSFYATFQQLMLSLGVCVAAVVLQLGMQTARHATPQFGEFTLAFIVVTAISASAIVANVRFAHDAGDELRGRHRAAAKA
jgi:EmrB/QacA subfamily drug resistance transporter